MSLVHKTKVSWLRDFFLGGQDGLVNVLGIVLGLFAAGGESHIIIVAGMAAAFAEAVSMGAVAYTSTLAQKDFYDKQKQNEKAHIEKFPEEEKQELYKIYSAKGFEGKLLDDIVDEIVSDKEVWVNIMMEEELDLSKVDTSSIVNSALVVGLSALVGSFVPILPLFFLARTDALIASIVVSALALFAAGVYEAKSYVGNWLHKGLQMVAIGMGAALVGFLVGRVFNVNP